MNAIKEPVSLSYRDSSWTFIDVQEVKDNGEHYIFGRLSKYKPLGEVTVVDTYRRTEETQIEPNLKVASSPFVYIPSHSGIAFLNVYNHIEQKAFVNRFCSIIEETYQRFFVDCDIELVSDLRSFAAKVSSLDGIYHVNAKISPPNPMFGCLWAELKDYLIKRNTDRMTIVEDAPESEPLNTDLPYHIEKAANQTADQQYVSDEPLPIGDAAILMAADGYGHGTVKGKRDNEVITIKTSETVKNFSFDKNPEPDVLYRKALEIFNEIKQKRHLGH
ncbi:hypothetical protein GWZ74_15095 [Vibrio cholerae]|nr:hypothetical protein [Vibrio cholerae]NOE97201.1 hypothetical protein [Vibrio cholerae]NOF00724.1 hypothetical protein [Vibrio cholerae]NOF15455.1 hypothetical protein [Vibrio cholerae]NOF18291.1 hypothetical protein [Vibrio cholerae]